MIEFFVSVILAIGIIEAGAELVTQGWTAAEPVVMEAYDHGSDAVKSIIPKATH